MKYLIIILLVLAIFSPVRAQNEKIIKIVPFRPSKEQVKRPNSSKRKQPVKKQPYTVNKRQMEKEDTVAKYLKKNNHPIMASPSSSGRYVATVPGFIEGERSRYQRGETQSSKKNIPFTFTPDDKFNRDPRYSPVIPNMKGVDRGGGGMGIGIDMNNALSMAFSKNARLRARNKKKKIWEKYPKVVPEDSVVKKLNADPLKMLSIQQRRDSTTAIKRDSVNNGR